MRMKKLIYLLGAFLVTLCMGLTSCKKSNADLIKDYEVKSHEINEALQSGDANKAEKLNNEAMKILNELFDRGLSREEEELLQKVILDNAIKNSSAVGSGALKKAGEMYDEGMKNAEKVLKDQNPESLEKMKESKKDVQGAMKDAQDELNSVMENASNDLGL